MLSIEQLKQLEKSTDRYVSTYEEYSERYHALHSLMSNGGYKLKLFRFRKQTGLMFETLIFSKKGKTVKINDACLWLMDDDEFLEYLDNLAKKEKIEVQVWI